jgi:hypothetical protein
MRTVRCLSAVAGIAAANAVARPVRPTSVPACGLTPGGLPVLTASTDASHLARGGARRAFGGLSRTF